MVAGKLNIACRLRATLSPVQARLSLHFVQTSRNPRHCSCQSLCYLGSAACGKV